MNRIFAFLFLFLFIVACNKDGTGGADCVSGAESQEVGATVCTVTSEPPLTDGTEGTGSEGNDATNTALPNEAFTFDINIKFINTTATQQAKFDQAIELIKKVVATEEFRTKILNHTYGGKKTFVDNGGHSNAQIYQKILEGAEKLIPAKNNTMDMEVELYYADNSTVGYTYPNSKRVWVNRKFFTSNTVGRVAANLFHEWLHKIGFGHAVSYSTSRDYSVPYAIGRMMTSISVD